MKCQFCGKGIDEVDCSCKMCTICGWALEAIMPDPPQAKPEEKDIPTHSGSQK